MVRTPLFNGAAAGKCRQNEMNIKKFTRFSAIVNVFFGNRVDFFHFWANLMDVDYISNQT
jgi:hypothetical protein